MSRLAYLTISVVLTFSSTAISVIADESILRDGKIGYVMTDLFWSVYQTPGGSEECPRGYNDGPREQFEKLFPAHEYLTVEETQLKQEIATWHPNTDPEEFEFFEVEGELSWGLNLDGEVDPNDFVHPDGSIGIDNEVYRAVGCIIGFRGPDGVEYIFQNKAIIDRVYNRMMIQLADVDSLENDESVTVNWFRGMDRLLPDASGQTAMSGGTQSIDRRWGESLIRQSTGKIEDGILTTDPIDELVIPWMNLSVPSVHIFRDARLQLNLSSEQATGLLAGYADVDTWYYQLIRNDSTHHHSNGQNSGISLYKALRRLADAYPDADLGHNTAISTAFDIKMTQVYVVDPLEENSE